MNKRAQKVSDFIEKEISAASSEFEMLLGIYGSKENLDILNKSSNIVFATLRNSLILSIILRLNKLTERAKDRQGNLNLCLERLRLALPSRTDENAALVDRLIAKEKEIKEAVRKLNKFRSKRIAHNDWPSMSGQWHKTVSNQAIDKSINLMEEYINMIYLHFDNMSVGLKPEFRINDNPQRLLKILKLGLEANQSLLDNA